MTFRAVLDRLLNRPVITASVARAGDGSWRVVVRANDLPVRDTGHPTFAEALADATSVTHRP